jgi:tetratricopeptide (TPR) repeat protein
MAVSDSTLPLPNAEHRRIAAAQYERANQVISTGNHDYGIKLLLSCCVLDPSNLIYRQTLRRTEKIKYKNNLVGSKMAGVTSLGSKAKLKKAKRAGEWLKVLEHGELILARNPWDTGAQLDMSEAADALGLIDMAVWSLEQARQKDPQDITLNRTLARLYEKRGNFTQAIALWELIRRVAPTDAEAQNKATNLAANETIQRGHYREAVNGGGGEGAEEEAAEENEEEEQQPAADVDADTRKAVISEARLARETAPLESKIKADPSSPHAYLSLAAAYRRAGKYDKAREALEAGLAATGQNFDLSIEMADLEIEPFRRNLVVADEKLRVKPEDEEVRKIRIRLLKEINTRELNLYREKSQRYPTEMTHRFELGVRLLRAGQIDEAIRELQSTRADPKNHWRSLMYLGHCFKTRNNWKLAQRNFEDALAHLPATEEPAKKEILFQLAQGAAEAGDLARAVDLANELANIDFTFRDIGKFLDKWETSLQKAKADA